MCVKCLQGTLLDEASGVRKKETELVVVSKTPKQPSSGGWNKVVLYCVKYPFVYSIVTKALQVDTHVQRWDIVFKFNEW